MSFEQITGESILAAVALLRTFVLHRMRSDARRTFEHLLHRQLGARRQVEAERAVETISGTLFARLE